MGVHVAACFWAAADTKEHPAHSGEVGGQMGKEKEVCWRPTGVCSSTNNLRCGAVLSRASWRTPFSTWTCTSFTTGTDPRRPTGDQGAFRGVRDNIFPYRYLEA